MRGKRTPEPSAAASVLMYEWLRQRSSDAARDVGKNAPDKTPNKSIRPTPVDSGDLRLTISRGIQKGRKAPLAQRA
jgi:hypothetical protein